MCESENERERSKDRWKGALKYEPETINVLWLTLSCKDWKDHTEIRNQAGWFLCCIYLLSFFRLRLIKEKEKRFFSFWYFYSNFIL